MRLTPDRDRYVPWKIKGVTFYRHEGLNHSISRMIAERTGEDTQARFSMALVSSVKGIIRENISLHNRRDNTNCASSAGCLPKEGVHHV